MGRVQRGGGNRSFGSDRGRGGISKGGNRSFGSDRGRGGISKGGNRSFGGDRGGNRGGRFRGNQNRGGFNGGNRKSFGGDKGGGGFFKKQQQNDGGFHKKDKLSDNRKRKFDSDESDEDEIVEKPKSILKTPRLDETAKSGKKVTMGETANNSSFQSKTPSTPHPIKGKASSGTTPNITKQQKEINFDDDSEESDSGESSGDEAPKAGKNSGHPLLKPMSFEDSDEAAEDDMESYEDMSGEDNTSDLEDEEDEGNLARLGGAEDDDSLEDEETSLDAPEDDEPVSKAKNVTDEPVSKAKNVVEKTNGSDEPPSKLSQSAVQLEKKRKIEFFKSSLYLPEPSDQVQQRKSLSTIHPFMTGAWKKGKGILLTFDSEQSRDTALKWFNTGEHPEFHNLKFVKADEEKSLTEESTKNADPTKLCFQHVPERFTKKHFKILFPNAECDMPVGGEAILTFKSSDAAQKALESSMDLKLFGARVLIKFNRSK